MDRCKGMTVLEYTCTKSVNRIRYIDRMQALTVIESIVVNLSNRLRQHHSCNVSPSLKCLVTYHGHRSVECEDRPSVSGNSGIDKTLIKTCGVYTYRTPVRCLYPYLIVRNTLRHSLTHLGNIKYYLLCRGLHFKRYCPSLRLSHRRSVEGNCIITPSACLIY